MDLLITGFIAGFVLASSIGPIAFLCMQRCLERGFWSGFVSGLGVASADAVYSAVAAFGLTFISTFLLGKQFWLQIVGIVFLLYLGLKALFKAPHAISKKCANNKGLLNDYASIFLLTLTNPMTIIMFMGVFTGAGLMQSNRDYVSASFLVLGFFLGSALLYSILCAVVELFHRRANSRFPTIANRVSGLIILGFALFLLLDLMK